MSSYDWATIERRCVEAGTIHENTLIMRSELSRDAGFAMRDLQDLGFRDLCKLWCDWKQQEEAHAHRVR